MDIITGDGGFDFSIDYNRQEESVAPLIFTQIIYAISMQKPGGTFILKIFDVFQNITVEMIYLLSLFYKEVSVSKPKTSRIANSERYIICNCFRPGDIRHFHGVFINFLSKLKENMDENHNLLKDLKSVLNIKIPLIFYNHLEEINAEIGQNQINNINQTIQLFDKSHNQSNRYNNP